MIKLLLRILRDELGVTLAITRKTANTLITAAGFNTNYDEIEAVVNALTSANFAADSVLAAALGSDVVRAGYGLVQHTDGSLYVDLSDTNPSLELTDGGLRLKVKAGLLSRGSDGVDWGRTGDVILSSSASTPDGFTDISATYEGKMIRISATALSAGGSDTLSGDTGSHVLTTDEMPAHTHTIGMNDLTGGSGTYVQRNPNAALTHTITSSSTGGGSGHTHTLTGVSCVPAYMTLKMYQKN